MNPSDNHSYKEPFLKSAKKHIEDVEHELGLLVPNLFLEKDIQELYIHMHSLKGECNFMSYNKIGDKCEEVIKIIKSVQNNSKIDQNIIDSLKSLVNEVKIMIETLDKDEILKT